MARHVKYREQDQHLIWRGYLCRGAGHGSYCGMTFVPKGATPEEAFDTFARENLDLLKDNRIVYFVLRGGEDGKTLVGWSRRPDVQRIDVNRTLADVTLPGRKD